MKIPPYFTTVTPFSKRLALTLFVTLPVISFASGALYQRSILIPAYEHSIQEMQADTRNVFDELYEDLSNALQDSAMIESQSTVSYVYEEFGISSSLFQNTEVDMTTFRYRLSPIIARRLVIDTNPTTYIITWEFPDNLSFEEWAIFFEASDYVPAFPVKELIESADITFETSDNSTYYVKYGNHNDVMLGEISAHRILKTSPSGKGMIISIYRDISQTNTSPIETEISKTVKDLKEIADTISYKNIN